MAISVAKMNVVQRNKAASNKVSLSYNKTKNEQSDPNYQTMQAAEGEEQNKFILNKGKKRPLTTKNVNNTVIS